MTQAVLEKPIRTPPVPDENRQLGSNLVVIPRRLDRPLVVTEPEVERREDHGLRPEPSRISSRRDRCEDIAIRLARCFTFEERLEIYRDREITYPDLSRAAALRPDLMPLLNGEYEWIALTAE